MQVNTRSLLFAIEQELDELFFSIKRDDRERNACGHFSSRSREENKRREREARLVISLSRSLSLLTRTPGFLFFSGSTFAAHRTSWKEYPFLLDIASSISSN